MTLGGALADLPKEQLQKAQRTMFFGNTCVCFVPGDRVLVAGADKATLWALAGPTVLSECKLEQASGVIEAMRFHEVSLPEGAAGDTILVQNVGALQLWELPRGAGGSIRRTRLDFSDPKQFRRVPVEADTKVRSRPGTVDLPEAWLSPDGNWLITNRQRLLTVWNTASGSKRAEVQDGKPGFGVAYAVTPDGSAVRAADGESIRLWRLPGLEPIRTIRLLDNYGFMRGVFGRNGAQTVGFRGQFVMAYDHQPPDAVRSLLPPNLHEQFRVQKDVAATGPVIGTNRDGIAIWVDGREERIPISRGIAPQVGTALLDAAGTQAVFVLPGLLSADIAVYDLRSRRPATTFRVSEAGGRSVRMGTLSSLSPDGKTVVVHSMSRSAVFDLKTKKAVPVLPDEQFVSVPLFTPDSRAVLVRLSEDKRLALVNVADGAELAKAEVEVYERELAFSPDGELLLGRNNRGLILRDGRSLRLIAERPTAGSRFTAGAFAPGGNMAAIGGDDGKLRLWDIRRREELVAIDLASGRITKVVFTPDGSKIRFIAEKQVGELDLHAYDPYVEGNLTWNLLRLLPDLSAAEAERVLNRLHETHPDAYRASTAILATAKPANQ
jgi:WD40 repeat protein